MIKIITTVGTSLLDNLDKDLRYFDNKTYFKYKKRYKYDIDKELKVLIKRLEDFKSAEIDTIRKIIEKYPDETFEVILISTDTLKGYIVASALKEYFKKEDFNGKIENVGFDEKYVIENLNVTNNSLDLIKKGSKNLIKTLIREISGYQEIINISGGYKAIIPLLTNIASFKKINLAYIYENSDYLIEIPPFPFDIDKSLVNYLREIFDEIEKESFISKEKFNKLQNKIPKDKQKMLEYLFEVEDENIITSTIGDILLEDYLENKEIKLVECKNKNFKIDGGRHHDKEKVIKFGKKLIENPYVCEILGSAEYESFKKDFILEIEPQNQIGVLKVKIPDEEKATILIKTSGRNFKETQKIAQILEKEFNS